MKYNPFKEKIRKFDHEYFKTDGGRIMILVENTAESTPFYQYYFADEMLQRTVTKSDFDEMIKNKEAGLTEITKEEAISIGRKYKDDDGNEKEDEINEKDLSKKHFAQIFNKGDRF